MIKSNIQTKFIHQHNSIKNFENNLYVADYTEQTKSESIKRAVEFFSPNAPSDISFFSIINPSKIKVDGIEFDNFSFVCGNGNSRTQCEAVFFPTVSQSDSWILFCELKYSSKPAKNSSNLKKAIKQLYKTRYYYCQYGIISQTNSSYLIASLPQQTEPFANFALQQPILTKLKRDKNIILRLKNDVEIINDKTLKI
jgi:hypothetical protein